MANIHYNNCPVCESEAFAHYMNAQDWGYSKKDFEIVKCSKCSFAFTQDVPDQEDIAVYYHHSDYVSHTDTNEGLFFKVYHKVREHMLNKKRVWVEKHTKKGSVLDIGAATGYFLANLKNNGWRVLGFEPEESAREIAKNYLNKKELDVLNRMVTAYLEVAELQALSGKPMYMKDWTSRLDDFLKMTGNDILDHAGKISHKIAVEKAHSEYEKFKRQEDGELSRAEKDFVIHLEQSAKGIKKQK